MSTLGVPDGCHVACAIGCDAKVAGIAPRRGDRSSILACTQESGAAAGDWDDDDDDDSAEAVEDDDSPDEDRHDCERCNSGY
jgi:hypothetical protein